MTNDTTYRGSATVAAQDRDLPDDVPVKAQAKFAMVPEWLLEADVSDGSVRLYGFLARYASSATGVAYPKRETLAHRMRKSVRSVSTYLKELESVGAIISTPKFRKGSREQDGNYYTVMLVQRETGLQNPAEPDCNTLQAPLATHCKPRTRASEREPVNDITPPPPTDGDGQGALDLVAEPSPPAGGGSTRKRDEYPPEFAAFWEVYPKKADKRAALKAWKAAKKRVLIDDNQLVVAAQSYRDDPNRDDQFTKNAATWLNADAWENGPLPQRNAPRNKAQDRLDNNMSVMEYFAQQEQTANYWGELER